MFWILSRPACAAGLAACCASCPLFCPLSAAQAVSAAMANSHTVQFIFIFAPWCGVYLVLWRRIEIISRLVGYAVFLAGLRSFARLVCNGAALGLQALNTRNLAEDTAPRIGFCRK